MVQPETDVSQAGPFVVAVSGTSGAGKSTLVEGLVAAYTSDGGRAVALHFDDYANVSQMPGSLIDWMERGADPEEWRTDQLVADLSTRISDTAARDTLIVVEEPFGRARNPVRALIDLAVHIELPLGISLARRLLRDFIPELGDLDQRRTDLLRDYLTLYVRGGGAAYELIDTMARETSDVVLDGLADRSELLNQVKREVARRSAPLGMNDA